MAALGLRHYGLFDAHALGNLRLGQAGFLPGVQHGLDEGEFLFESFIFAPVFGIFPYGFFVQVTGLNPGHGHSRFSMKAGLV